MSDAANPAAHNTDNEQLVVPLSVIEAFFNTGMPGPSIKRLRDAAFIGVPARAALSAAPPNDPLGRMVYIVEGWFGEVEWIEGVYATPQAAASVSEDLWRTRTSPKGPEHAAGLHKFAVTEWPLLAALAGAPEAPGA